MEVPLLNNLNDNGDRLRSKGKDVFKEQQKESEVGTVRARGVRVRRKRQSLWFLSVARLLLGSFFGTAARPFLRAAVSKACPQTGTLESLFWRAAPKNKPLLVILRCCSTWRLQVAKCGCCLLHGCHLIFTFVDWTVSFRSNMLINNNVVLRVSSLLAYLPSCDILT